MSAATSETVPFDTSWHRGFLEAVHSGNLVAAREILWPLLETEMNPAPPGFAQIFAGTSFLAQRKCLRGQARALIIKLCTGAIGPEGLHVPRFSRSVAQILNSFSIIATLPEDILIEIFLIISSYGAREILNVSHVYSPWRQLVYSVASLWTIIVCDQKSNSLLLEHFFRSSNNKPVTLEAFSDCRSIGHVLADNPAFNDQIIRIRLRRHPYPSVISCLEPLLNVSVFPNLVGLAAGPSYSTPHHQNDSVFGMLEGGRFPALRRLALSHMIPISATSRMGHEGTHLGKTLEDVLLCRTTFRPESLHNFISECPKLKSIQFTDCALAEQENDATMSPPAVRLASLWRLRLNRCNRAFVFYVLHLLVAPELVSFTLYPRVIRASSGGYGVTRSSTWNQLAVHFLSRTTKLQHLSLTGTAETLEPWARSLLPKDRTTPMLPNLERLWVLYTPIEEHVNNCSENLGLTHRWLWDFCRQRQYVPLMGQPWAGDVPEYPKFTWIIPRADFRCIPVSPAQHNHEQDEEPQFRIQQQQRFRRADPMLRVLAEVAISVEILDCVDNNFKPGWLESRFETPFRSIEPFDSPQS